jgi:hypothetical protein
MSGDPAEELAAWTVIDFEAEDDGQADSPLRADEVGNGSGSRR